MTSTRPDPVRHPAIGAGPAHEWTGADLRAAVIAQAHDDARLGPTLLPTFAAVPWRGVYRAVAAHLEPAWRDDAHRHPAWYGWCPLDPWMDDLGTLYAEELERAAAAIASVPR